MQVAGQGTLSSVSSSQGSSRRQEERIELSLYLHQVSTGTSSTCNWTVFSIKLSVIKSPGKHTMLGYLEYNYRPFTNEVVLILKCIPEFVVL